MNFPAFSVMLFAIIIAFPLFALPPQGDEVPQVPPSKIPLKKRTSALSLNELQSSLKALEKIDKSISEGFLMRGDLVLPQEMQEYQSILKRQGYDLSQVNLLKPLNHEDPTLRSNENAFIDSDGNRVFYFQESGSNQLKDFLDNQLFKLPTENNFSFDKVIFSSDDPNKINDIFKALHLYKCFFKVKKLDLKNLNLDDIAFKTWLKSIYDYILPLSKLESFCLNLNKVNKPYYLLKKFLKKLPFLKLKNIDVILDRFQFLKSGDYYNFVLNYEDCMTRHKLKLDFNLPKEFSPFLKDYIERLRVINSDSLPDGTIKHALQLLSCGCINNIKKIRCLCNSHIELECITKSILEKRMNELEEITCLISYKDNAWVSLAHLANTLLDNPLPALKCFKVVNQINFEFNMTVKLKNNFVFYNNCVLAMWENKIKDAGLGRNPIPLEDLTIFNPSFDQLNKVFELMMHNKMRVSLIYSGFSFSKNEIYFLSRLVEHAKKKNLSFQFSKLEFHGISSWENELSETLKSAQCDNIFKANEFYYTVIQSKVIDFPQTITPQLHTEGKVELIPRL